MGNAGSPAYRGLLGPSAGQAEAEALDALRDELQRLRAAAARDRQVLDALLDDGLHGVLAWDATGRVLLANAAAAGIWAADGSPGRASDWSRARGLRPDGPAFPLAEWALARAARAAAAAQPEELAFERFDGTRGVLLASVAPLRGPAGAVEGAILTFADVTRFKQLEATLLASERVELARAKRLQAVTAALTEALTPEQVADVTVDEARAALGASAGGLWLVEPGGRFLELVRHSGYDGAAVERFGRIPLDGAERIPVVDAVRSREALWIESGAREAATYPPIAAFLADRRRGEYALACLPLLGESRCLGAVAFSFDGPCRFEARERAFLLVVVRHAALALERARLYDAERRARAAAEASERRSAFLSEASALLASSLDYQSTLASAARLAVPGIADWFSVDLADAFWAGEPPVVVAHVDPAMEETAREWRRRYPADREAGRGVPEVLRTGRPEIYAEVTDEMLVESARDEDHLKFTRALRIKSAMVVPMRARGRVLGAITFVSTQEGRRYGGADLEMAAHLARRAGLAIDNALLYSEAQRAAQAREEVLAIVSHDLKNPLGAVLMSAVLLQRGPPDPQRLQKHAASIHRNAQRMERLIHDLLDLSALDAGKFRVEPAPQEVAPLLADALSLLAPLAAEKGVRLEARPPSAGAIRCDRERMLQVLSNLLGNALAFTPAGGRIEVRCEPGGGGDAVFSVADTGVGIPEEDQPHVFDRYWRSMASRRGSGLGLAIAKGIVEAHGGRIWFESRPGEGTTFHFTLPRAGGDDRWAGEVAAP